MDNIAKAYGILKEWKGDNYIFGFEVIDKAGEKVAEIGKKGLLVANQNHLKDIISRLESTLERNGAQIITHTKGAKANSLLDDIYRIAATIIQYKPDFVIAAGGGSTLDAAKAAAVISSLSPELPIEADQYYGTGKVSASLCAHGKTMIPIIAIQSVSSSASHLTKYANVTDLSNGQKKLIVDNAVVPHLSVFDYSATLSLPISVTVEGILDSLSHSYEVFLGAKGDAYDKAEEIFRLCAELLFEYSSKLIENPKDRKAREAICLASDLGGYAIMIGGTSGGHLTSFSLVDAMSHGIACGIMNPYYTVFYGCAIKDQLECFKDILEKYGYIKGISDNLSTYDLSIAVANGMIEFSRSIGAPVKLSDIKAFNKNIHITRALKAAKDPDLEMKLKNMPIPLSAADIDPYMAPILEAALSGDFKKIRTM